MQFWLSYELVAGSLHVDCCGGGRIRGGVVRQEMDASCSSIGFCSEQQEHWLHAQGALRKAFISIRYISLGRHAWIIGEYIIVIIILNTNFKQTKVRYFFIIIELFIGSGENYSRSNVNDKDRS